MSRAAIGAFLLAVPLLLAADCSQEKAPAGAEAPATATGAEEQAPAASGPTRALREVPRQYEEAVQQGQDRNDEALKRSLGQEP